jgi:hypothetical protein
MGLRQASEFTIKAGENSDAVTGGCYNRLELKPKLQFGFSLNGVYTINSQNICPLFRRSYTTSLSSQHKKISHVRTDLAHGFCDSNMTDVSLHALGIKPVEPILNMGRRHTYVRTH